MSERVFEFFLIDVYIAIIKIEIVAASFETADELLSDFVPWDSVIREFEIIGEATKQLIDAELIDSKYRVVVDFRNKITHHYFGIDHEAVWSIIHDNLPEFKNDIMKVIKLVDKDLLHALISAALEDNSQYPQILQELAKVMLAKK